ncbi:MAG: GNAT family protein [Candidatus Binatia bacterium]
MPDLRLVPFDRAHLPAVREWILDPETRDLVGTRIPPSDRQHERWYERLQDDPTRVTFVVADGTMGQPLAACGFTGLDHVARGAELWLYVGDRARRGLGIGRFAVRELLAFGFQTLGLHRVSVRVFGFNSTARAFFQRCGFVDEGVDREAVFRHGRFHDVWRLAILDRELA